MPTVDVWSRFSDDSSSGRGRASVMITVRDPSPGADVDGMCVERNDMYGLRTLAIESGVSRWM